MPAAWAPLAAAPESTMTTPPPQGQPPPPGGVREYQSARSHSAQNSGDLTLENIQIVTLVAVIHFTFVLSAIGISFAERLTREQH